MSDFDEFRVFIPRSDGDFDVTLGAEARKAIVALAKQLEQAVTEKSPDTKRLFPTAYADDKEKDQGYQVFAREQLVQQRQQAATLIADTALNEVLTTEELSVWMGAINDFRLVLGTKLDVCEDDDFDLDSPMLDEYILYRYLSELVEYMVIALGAGLPEDPPETEFLI